MKTIKDIPTRKLLKMLDSLRGEGWWPGATVSMRTAVEATSPHAFVVGVNSDGEAIQEVVHCTADEIRSELSTREHIPTKNEAKILRRLKAQTGMTEAQLRAHPKFGAEFFPKDRRVVSAELYECYKIGGDDKHVRRRLVIGSKQ